MDAVTLASGLRVVLTVLLLVAAAGARAYVHRTIEVCMCSDVDSPVCWLIADGTDAMHVVLLAERRRRRD
jgi:hypothetical protein